MRREEGGGAWSNSAAAIFVDIRMVRALLMVTETPKSSNQIFFPAFLADSARVGPRPHPKERLESSTAAADPGK